MNWDSISAGNLDYITSAMKADISYSHIEKNQRILEEAGRQASEKVETMVAGAKANIAQKEILEKELELLKEQNKNLQQQLELAIKNEEHAKAEAKHNRIWVYISAGIAFASLIATILIAVLK